MFKKILIPTDGSPLSAQAANAGICFARSVGAEIVALYVTQPFAATIGFDGMAAAYAITDEDYEKASAEHYRKTGKFLDGATLVKEIRKLETSAMTTGNPVVWGSDAAVWFVMV